MSKYKNINYEEVMFSSLQFIDSTFLEEVIAILTKRFEIEIQIKSIMFLSEPERRNIVLRITLENPTNGAPNSLILKQSLLQKSSEDDQEVYGRFARDWAGLEFLSSFDLKIAPRIYGGSQKYRFMLMEDLGGVHFSLVDSLWEKVE